MDDEKAEILRFPQTRVRMKSSGPINDLGLSKLSLPLLFLFSGVRFLLLFPLGLRLLSTSLRVFGTSLARGQT